MHDITKIKVDGEPESSYQLYPRNEEFAKRSGGGNGGSNVQPDWNQNDETQPDYVKNRPFYTGDLVETVLVEESTVEFAEDNSGKYVASFPTSFNAEFGATYKVSWDGSIYTCVCENFNNRPILGNQSIVGVGPDTGEPFIIFNEEGVLETGWFSLTTDTSASHTISISGCVSEVVKIDAKYLPDIIIYGISTAQSTADTAQSTANTAQSTADAAQSTADAAQSTANTAQSTADVAQSTADAAQSTADGCVKINNSGTFKINLDDNSYFSGSTDVNGIPYYKLRQKNVSDTPIVLSIGANGGTDLAISVTPSTSPTVKITPPIYLSNHADIEIVRHSGHQASQITGLGGITMYSSTSGSTKKFKITVDDSGALTATEVT